MATLEDSIAASGRFAGAQLPASLALSLRRVERVVAVAEVRHCSAQRVQFARSGVGDRCAWMTNGAVAAAAAAHCDWEPLSPSQWTRPRARLTQRKLTDTTRQQWLWQLRSAAEHS